MLSPSVSDHVTLLWHQIYWEDVLIHRHINRQAVGCYLPAFNQYGGKSDPLDARGSIDKNGWLISCHCFSHDVKSTFLLDNKNGFLFSVPLLPMLLLIVGYHSGFSDVLSWYFVCACVTDEALSDAKWAPSEQEQKEMTGVSIGGGTGSISDILDAAQMICEKRLRRLSPFFIPRILINMASGHVSMRYGFQGPNHAAVTACATGAHSIGDAVRMIQFGDSDVMVAGGTESSIDALSIAGFCRSRALTTKYNSCPQEASRPFDCGRDGFVIGEGSGILVLELINLSYVNDKVSHGCLIGLCWQDGQLLNYLIGHCAWISDHDAHVEISFN
ncbi:3-oxoacyl-[acyl-carrier-protein] synthase, mitochondrial [Vitis vinifera]|uniref:beta-ketoacyl-[acyl-carrier-protein] synthase I n=1 Tax=Vitis vinifera TaxID=29760 RepID=A0A438BQV2_VITVI|nr:3-oxoacyl-[acyl-carrier-protein] synthase, mitochondrial [Vitis vinifera]